MKAFYDNSLENPPIWQIECDDENPISLDDINFIEKVQIELEHID